MKILISNDDGIHSKGIRVLAERLAEEDIHEVYVVAPDRERSATGHSLTLHKPLRTATVEFSSHVKAAWSTTGTPSDCVKLAVMELLPERPDIVISGINNGPNLGSEVLYSGTVAAAMEGAFLDIPSVAVSMEYGEKRHWEVAAEFINSLVSLFPKAHLAPRTLLNVNVPNLPSEDIQGVLITELGVRLYNDWFEKRTDPRGRVYYWLAGHAIDEGEAEHSDAWAVYNKNISITPISFNMTDRATKDRLLKLPELTKMFSHDPKKKPIKSREHK
ncbi:MAG TPA: 5'/3'-nucleotidase SurE [Chroococcales cyanobacterium]